MADSQTAPRAANPDIAAAAPRRSRGAWLIATFFGVGFLRPGPGTFASIVTVLLWALAARFIPLDAQPLVALALATLATLVGIPAATVVARESGRRDPGIVVIDEVAGQMLALVLVPARWKYLLLGLILFRAFDILKPPPLRRLEKLPGGAGIMLDDVAAGLYAFLVMQALLHFHVL